MDRGGMAYVHSYEGRQLLIVLNFSDAPLTVRLPREFARASVVFASDGTDSGTQAGANLPVASLAGVIVGHTSQ